MTAHESWSYRDPAEVIERVEGHRKGTDLIRHVQDCADCRHRAIIFEELRCMKGRKPIEMCRNFEKIGRV